MTNNIKVTEGEGKTVATDSVAGVQYQRVKLDKGANGSSSPVGEGNPLPVEDTLPGTPSIYNVTLTTADTEYSQALPGNCRFFEFQCLTDYDIRFAFEEEKVATPTSPFMTLKAGGYYYSPAINQSPITTPATIYLASSQAAVSVQILAWI